MPTPTAFGFTTIPHIHCAAGAAALIGQHVRAHFPTTRRALIVTDGDLHTAGMTDAPRRSLEQAGLAVSIYSGVIASPPEAVVRHAVDFAREHHPDLVIGIGGGSALDVAKLVAVMTASGQTLAQLADGAVPAARLPLVLVPTTAAGAHATALALVNTADGSRIAVQGAQLMADLAILDAGEMLALPPLQTAASGMLAIAHAIGATTSAFRNPLSDLLAHQALTLLSRHLLACCDQGEDLHARQAVMLGAHLAAQAVDNAQAPLLRALACPLGTLFRVSYAESVALMLPHLLRAQLAEHVEQFAALAAIVAPHVEGSAAARAEALVVAMQQLAKTTGLASSLESIGARDVDLGRLADEAMLQWRLLYRSACPVPREQVRALYAAAL
jgi:alcohol dehydrogenase